MCDSMVLIIHVLANLVAIFIYVYGKNCFQNTKNLFKPLTIILNVKILNRG